MVAERYKDEPMKCFAKSEVETQSSPS